METARRQGQNLSALSHEHEGMSWHSIQDLKSPNIVEGVRETGALAIRYATGLPG